MKQAGAPFAATATPGEHLLALLDTMVRTARQHPEDSLAFTPLFLDEMARRQLVPVELTGGLARPDRVYLSPLETQLLLAMFERTSTGAPRRVAHFRPRRHRRDQWASPTLRFASYTRRDDGRSPALAESNACSDKLSRWLGRPVPAAAAGDPPFDPVDTYLRETFVDQGIERFLEEGAGEGSGENAMKVKEVAEAILRLQKLVNIYNHVVVAVDVADKDGKPITVLHKDLTGEKVVGFRARAFVDKDAVEADATDADLSKCLEWAGLPPVPTVARIGKEADKWRAKFRLEASPEHAVFQPNARSASSGGKSDYDSRLGQLEMRLTRTDELGAQSRFAMVTITREKLRAHTGRLRETTVTMRVEVRTDNAEEGVQAITDRVLDGIKVMIASASGSGNAKSELAGYLFGTGKDLVVITANGIEAFFTQSGSGSLKVLYHERAVPSLVGDVTFSKRTDRVDRLAPQVTRELHVRHDVRGDLRLEETIVHETGSREEITTIEEKGACGVIREETTIRAWFDVTYYHDARSRSGSDGAVDGVEIEPVVTIAVSRSPGRSPDSPGRAPDKPPTSVRALLWSAALAQDIDVNDPKAMDALAEKSAGATLSGGGVLKIVIDPDASFSVPQEYRKRVSACGRLSDTGWIPYQPTQFTTTFSPASPYRKDVMLWRPDQEKQVPLRYTGSERWGEGDTVTTLSWKLELPFERGSTDASPGR
jgi:hypothetical protein